MYLFLDTETTDMPDGDGVKQGQGRVCQVAMLLTDATGYPIAEFSTLIRPDNWAVGAEAGAVHGFTTEKCAQYGIDGNIAYEMFRHFAARADYIVAHNAKFDRQMMRIEDAYNGLGMPQTPWTCTMRMATPHTELPPTQKMIDMGMGHHFKAPSLNQALTALCGRTMGDEAHDALWDVRACKDIFFALKAKAEEAGEVFKPEILSDRKGWTPRPKNPRR